MPIVQLTTYPNPLSAKHSINRQMAFQFYCPNGHLLQANEEQIGQTCICPSCQVEIIIPAPSTNPQAGVNGAPQPPLQSPPPGQPPVSTFSAPVFQQTVAQDAEKTPNQQNSPDPFQLSKKKKKKFDFGPSTQEPEGTNGEKKVPSINITVKPEDNKILHCLCPSGHSLTIEREMIGQQAMCPYCQKTFEIRMDRTVEYINKKRREAEVEEKKMATLWLYWALITAIFAVIFIVIMFVLVFTRS